jgi:hypothetical protein
LRIKFYRNTIGLLLFKDFYIMNTDKDVSPLKILALVGLVFVFGLTMGKFFNYSSNQKAESINASITSYNETAGMEQQNTALQGTGGVSREASYTCTGAGGSFIHTTDFVNDDPPNSFVLNVGGALYDCNIILARPGHNLSVKSIFGFSQIQYDDPESSPTSDKITEQQYLCTNKALNAQVPIIIGVDSAFSLKTIFTASTDTGVWSCSLK